MHFSKSNDRQTFKRMYETNVSALVRFAQRYTPADVAEDIVQDVFLELWKNEKTLDEASARYYLFTSVRNRCINHLNKEQTKESFADKAVFEIQQHGLAYFDSPDKLIIEREELQQVYDRIEELPEKCRRIFKLSYFEDKKSIEIAELMNLSIRTVEHQLYLGLKTLRERLRRK